MSWASEWAYLSSCEGRQKGCLLWWRERGAFSSVRIKQPLWPLRWKKKTGAAKCRLVFFFPTSAGYRTCTQQTVRVRLKQLGLLEHPTSSCHAALAKPLHGKSSAVAVGWQGMESGEAQQPGLIIRLFLGLGSSCPCHGQVTPASVHAPTRVVSSMGIPSSSVLLHTAGLPIFRCLLAHPSGKHSQPARTGFSHPHRYRQTPTYL